MKAIFQSAHQDETSPVVKRDMCTSCYIFKNITEMLMCAQCMLNTGGKSEGKKVDFHSRQCHEYKTFVNLLSAAVTSDACYSLSACSHISHRESAYV